MKVRPSGDIFHDFASAGSVFWRGAIDLDQIGVQAPDDFARNRIGRGDRIQMFSAQNAARRPDASAVAAGRAFDAREFFTLINSLGSGSAGHQRGRAQTHYQG